MCATENVVKKSSFLNKYALNSMSIIARSPSRRHRHYRRHSPSSSASSSQDGGSDSRNRAMRKYSQLGHLGHKMSSETLGWIHEMNSSWTKTPPVQKPSPNIAK